MRNRLAFDSTNSNFGLQQAQQAGTKVAIRYFSLQGESEWKILKLNEAQALADAGFAILPVFQFAGNRMSAFGRDKGRRDAKHALLAADDFKMPQGSTILFGVDWDPSKNQIRGHIIPYFEEVRKVFGDSGKGYRVGIYGSGMSCRLVSEESGLVDLTWLAQATGWREYVAYRDSKKWGLLQHMPTHTSAGEFNFDDVNIPISELGAFVYSGTGSRLVSGVSDNGDLVTDDKIVVVDTEQGETSGATKPYDSADDWPGIVFTEDGEHPLDLVKKIQRRLNLLSYGPVAVDGDYGRATANQVRSFQARNDDPDGIALDVDGKIGKNTWWALFVDSDIVFAATPPADDKSDSENFVQIALSQNGVREQPRGTNRGPSIDAYIQSVGLEPWGGAYAWCACFVHWCGATLEHLGGAENRVPKTGGVHRMWNLGRNSAVDVVRSAQASDATVKRGMVFFIDTGGGKGHTGIVTGIDGQYVTTVEGNTNAGGGREGDGVYLRRRKIKMSGLMGYLQFFDD